jgi:hypothetical protein
MRGGRSFRSELWFARGACGESLVCYTKKGKIREDGEEVIPGCDESDSFHSGPVDAANSRKQAVLFCKKEPKKLLFIRY